MPAFGEVGNVKEPTTDHQQDKYGARRPSQLFLLRVWIPGKNASHGSEDSDLAGKVQDPVSGQVQYFSGGMELARILLRWIRNVGNW